MRVLAWLALATTFALSAFPADAQERAPERYSAIRLPAADGALFHRLAAAGVGLDHTQRIKTAAGPVLHTVVSAADRARLDAAGIVYSVEVNDLAAAYDARPQPSAARLAAAEARKSVDGFGYGSMGGFYTLAEVEAKLDEMAADYPELITPKVSIGQTHEGRDVWQVWISDHPALDEGEPEVLYTALHHAREPNAMAAVVYYMFYLLENYGTDPEVTYLVDNRRLAFVPVLNPDGYAYNEATNPNGGGFWRKNRRVNGGGTFGVDLNRNYGYEWGYDNSGSSPSPSSDTYRGPAPFSEPETQAVRDFVNGQTFGLAFNYHTYSDLLIYPWGFEASFFTPDSARFVDYAADMTRYNGYLAGTGDQTVGYLVNGDSDDWMYGDTAERPKILSMTPEVGYAFWPDQEDIFEQSEENVYPNLRLAWYAGGAPLVTGVALDGLAGDGLDPGEAGVLQVTVKNAGLAPLQISARELADESGRFDVSGGTSDDVVTLETDEAVTFPFAIRALPGAPLGPADGLSVVLNLGGQQVHFPVGPVLVGTPVVFFEDDASTLDGWSADGLWGLTGDAVSAPSAFTDSPDGDYRDNAFSRLRLVGPIDLSETTSAQLTFWTKWQVEQGYDYVQVRASSSGTNWTALEGRYTRAGGGGVQPDGQPIYDGFQTTWVQEQMPLDAFAGQSAVYLEFRQGSDLSVTEDGWTIDDIAVSRIVDASAVSTDAPADAARFALHAPAPNPSAGGALAVRYALPAAGPVRLALLDVLGREVAVLVSGEQAAGEQRAALAGRALAPGLYVLRLDAAGQVATQKLTVTR